MTTPTLTRTPAGTLAEVRSLLLDALRADCAEAGITAESPRNLDAEDRRLYREERQN